MQKKQMDFFIKYRIKLLLPLLTVLLLTSCKSKEEAKYKCDSCESYESKYYALEKEYEELKKEHNTLEDNYDILEDNYNALETSLETEYVTKYDYDTLKDDHSMCEDKMFDMYRFINEDIAIIKFGEINTYHSFDCIYSFLFNEIYDTDEIKQITSISEAKRNGYKQCHCDNPYYYDEETDDGGEYMLRTYVEDNYIHIDDVQNEYIHIDDIDDYIEDNYDY